MPERSSTNVGFRHLLHPDRRHDPSGDTLALKQILHGKSVDDRSQHTHVVRLNTIHSLLAGQSSAHDISTADHETENNFHLVNRFYFVSELVNY